MDVIIVIMPFLAFGLAVYSVATMLAYMRQIGEIRTELKAKVEEFAKITKTACEANTSLAEKLIQMDQRLDNIESWRSIMGINNPVPTTSWKK